jgi:hypothetical protein
MQSKGTIEKLSNLKHLEDIVEESKVEEVKSSSITRAPIVNPAPKGQSKVIEKPKAP